MIQRRTLLSALPFAFIAACTKPQAVEAQAASAAAASPKMTGESANLVALTGGAKTPKWLRFTGTLRLIAENATPRAVTLHRAVILDTPTSAPRFFDVWDVIGASVVAAPSLSTGSGIVEDGTNDLGVVGTWLQRGVTFPGLTQAIEHSRLAAENARLMVIDATQILLVDGGVAANLPVLTDTTRAAFDAWQRA